MARHSKKYANSAAAVLDGEVTSISEIARRVKVGHTRSAAEKGRRLGRAPHPHRQAGAEQLVERLATEKTNLNATHYKLWQGVVARVYGSLGKDRLGRTRSATWSASPVS